MKTRTWIAASVLLLLTGGTAAGWFRTRELPAAPAQAEAAKPAAKGKRPRRPLEVDESPLRTAKSLAALPMAAEEQGFAHQAVQVANHEVDLAFADALRRAVDRPPTPTPETKPLFDAKDRAEKSLKTEQEALASLEGILAKAKPSEKDDWEDHVSAQKAQVDLAKDELEDAEADLEKAGLDPQAAIQRLIDAHKAAEQVEADQEATLALPFQVQAGSLLARYQAWSQLHRKQERLDEAEHASLERGPALAAERAAFLQRRKDRQAAAEAGEEEDPEPKAAAKRRVEDLKRQVRLQRVLTGFTKRAQDEKELAQVYGSWGDLVEVQARMALHAVLSKVFWIVVVLLGVFMAGLLIDRKRAGNGEEIQRTEAMYSVAKVSVQVLGLLVIVFLVLGMPGQATTILGLAGAGLTVALKDFIVAFFGWFVLMGKNGLHVGDWVEIKGVGGEVVEITLLRTVLLETGSWSDAGHPTGRRVAFVNSFAIEGHYFNFSTSGQWMWDELQVLIPSGQEPYPIIEGIKQLVDQDTEANARQAEQEWQKATTRYRVRAFSAAPGINVVPTGAGIEVRVRYITRAHERHETRKRLYQAVMELMHGRPAAEA